MVVKKLSLAALLLLLVASVGYAGTLKENDAGSWTDAGDTMDAAYALPAWGAYQANMTKHDGVRDTDWYRAPAAAAATVPQCLEFSGDANMWTNLTVVARTPTGDLRAAPSFVPNQRTHVWGGIAVPAHQAAWLGNVPNSRDATADPTRPGSYAFTFYDYDRNALGATDGGANRDAASTLENATPAPGPCVSGVLSFGGDTKDVFSFPGYAGTDLGVSFALPGNQSALLNLYDPAGVKLAEVRSGQYVQVPVPANGTYYVSVLRTDIPPVGAIGPFGGAGSSSANVGTTSVGDTDITYLIGIVMGPERPGGAGCRPNC